MDENRVYEDASILFSDLKGFSKLELDSIIGDVTKIFKKDADELLSEILHFYDNTWGDALIVCSQNSVQLARFALRLRNRIATRNWENDRIPKEKYPSIRIALHFGTIEKHLNEAEEVVNVSGNDVNLAARIEPVVEPNEVFVSEKFYHVIRDKLPSNKMVCDKMGDFELPKQAGTLNLYQLRWSHEVSNFKPSTITDEKRNTIADKSLSKPLKKPSDRQSKRADSIESHVPSILPSPFEWIYIPEGITTLNYIGGYLQHEKNYSVKPFAISKYPITISQFARFIDTGGYKNRQYWSKVVWADEKLWDSIIKTESIISKENAENPVSRLTWHEISAFCNWLSDVTGENITLPSEPQWQHAAQGDDKRKYTWGDKWDCQRCNCNVIPCQSEGITSIKAYESLGISPFGVVDMVGNVWEYTSTLWNYERVDMKSTEPRVLRGGSWVNQGSSLLNTLCRFSDDYDDYDFSTEFRGFRLVKLDI